jgi:hypothetical protein
MHRTLTALPLRAENISSILCKTICGSLVARDCNMFCEHWTWLLHMIVQLCNNTAYTNTTDIAPQSWNISHHRMKYGYKWSSKYIFMTKHVSVFPTNMRKWNCNKKTVAMSILGKERVKCPWHGIVYIRMYMVYGDQKTAVGVMVRKTSSACCIHFSMYMNNTHFTIKQSSDYQSLVN